MEMIDQKEIHLALAFGTLSKLPLQENSKIKPPQGGILGGEDPPTPIGAPLGLGMDLE